jgi:sugar lactone lactonase YvrE
MNRARTKMPMLAVAAGLLLIFAPVGRAADALAYFKNYFVTGDYTVAGVGLRGTGVGGYATGTINITGVPCTKNVVGPQGSYEACSIAGAVPSDIVAAFLYWETEESSSTPAAINGMFDGNAIVGKNLGNASNASCWNTENGGAPQVFGRVYRADVLRYLKIDTVHSVRLANGAHSVQLPDQGSSGAPGSVLLTNGATLVIVYRVVVPGNPAIAPFKAVVIYDGSDTVTKTSPAMTQTIGGIYESVGGPSTMTPIVANGQLNFKANLRVNQSLISQAPFTGTAGARWDNPVFGMSLNYNDASFSTTVDSLTGNNECLTFAAIVASTPVVDTDNDGLLDVWETKGMHLNPGTATTPATFGGCKDYPSDPCVNLPAMGAKASQPDIFVQIDWMHGTGDGTGGTDGHGFHRHMPNAQALALVCSAFSGSARNVALHFDVGNNYQGQPCIVPYMDATGKVLAQGGSDIDEATLLCPNAVTPAADCTYSEPYAVLSYKRTFLAVKNGYPVLNIPQHFDHSRKDIFHYSLWSHAVAGPFDASGKPLTKDPKSISGVADRPGGDLMITLGLWRSDIPANDQVGSALVQAGTFMHELGHNLDLSHAGLLRIPNCMPNYPSVMNYLYQTRGLTDAAGNEHIDFSYGRETLLNEGALGSRQYIGPLTYRIRYFGPLGPGSTPGQASQVHCDGTPITNGALAIRSEGLGVSGPPEWSNGTIAGSYMNFQFDLNFDGTVPESFYDQPDWGSLNLQQISARPNVNGLSADIHLGAADLGAADLGAADLGAADLGAADLGAADLGAADLGAADLGAADLGAADLGDIDSDTLILSSPDPPPSPTPGCPAPQCGLAATNELGDVLLQWAPPGTGKIGGYNIYRCAVIAPATSCKPTMGAPLYSNVSGGTATPSYKDTVNDQLHAGATCPATATCFNTTYTYAVTALVGAANSVVESSATNTATSEVTHLFVIADSMPTVVYGSANPGPLTFKIYGDVAGSLASSVTCAYPGTPRNAGTYFIVCSGPATTSAADGVTYNASYLNYTPGSFTITQRPITVTAVTSNKVYNALTNSPATPTITSGNLVYNDTVTWTETYDNPNVGSTHLMTPGGAVSDQNGGANYKVTFVTFSPGMITPATLTVTPDGGKNKVYGQVFTGFTGTVTGLQGSDAGTPGYASTGAPAGAAFGIYDITSHFSFTSGLATNYTVVNNTATAGLNVVKAILTITAGSGSKPYGAPLPAITPTYNGFANGDTPAVLTAVPICGTTATGSSPVASYPTSCSGAAALNYAFNYVAGILMVTPVPLTINPGNASRLYLAPNPVFPFTYAGLVNGDVTIATPPTCGTTTPLNASPGMYNTISCTGAASPNYAPISYGPNGTLTIKPSAPTLYIVDGQNNRIRFVNPTGTITTAAGNGIPGFTGDGGAATSAELRLPVGAAVDSLGNLYIADTQNNRVRMVTAAGTITTIAGNGSAVFSGDGGPAVSAGLNYPANVAVDNAGNLYIADEYSNRIRKVSASGIITTVAGNGTLGSGGDSGPATSAQLYYPTGLAFDGSGNLYIADNGNQRIRKVDATGIITTVAGTGTASFSGDGGPATAATLNDPTGVAVDTAGNLYIADYGNQRIRKINTLGTITTVAGNGISSYLGDGGPATAAELNYPTGVALDAAGNLYIADFVNNRIRKVDTTGTITTFAGNGTPGYLGDGGTAASSELYQPTSIVVAQATQ